MKNTYWCYQEDLLSLDKTTIVSIKKQAYEIVEFESEEKKVKKTKKVFDLGLFGL